MVYYFEISYKGLVNFEKYYKEGDEVYVKVIVYDVEKRCFLFFIKVIIEDLWEEI